MSRLVRPGGALLLLLLVVLGWWLIHVWTEPSVKLQLGSSPGVPFANSLQGTVPDGDLPALPSNAHQAVVAPLPYGELKRLFDYYLSAVGEQTVEAVSQEIASDLARRLSPNQLPQAQDLMSRYLQYKRALADMEMQPLFAGNDARAMRQRLLAMQNMRGQFFNADEDNGMFGFEDEYDLDAVSRVEISQNPALSALQKAQELAAMDAHQSERLRLEREAPRQVEKVEQMAQALRSQGASEDDVYRMRAQAFTPEAAARWAELDREEAHWRARIASYLAARVKLLQAFADNTPAERDAALVALQQSLFSLDEQRRLPAYEQ